MGNIDYGHYIDSPIVSGEGTMLVPKGMSLHDTYILTKNEPLPFNQIILEANACADICIFVFPNVSLDIPIKVNLIGEGANINLRAAYICGKEEKVNFKVEVIHRVPNCISNQVFNGIVGGRAEVKFSGKIVVAPDAQQTEAYQINKNVLLSTDAKIHTKPQLEIYADDVKCSHGATQGGLNEDEQFYMRSRGIPAKEAKVLQAISFIYPIINHVADKNDKAAIAEAVEYAVRSIIK